MQESRLVLYVDDGDPITNEALAMLREAGFEVRVKVAPTHYHAAYSIPVLFGLFNKFEGLEGIRIFLQNATCSQSWTQGRSGL